MRYLLILLLFACTGQLYAQQKDSLVSLEKKAEVNDLRLTPKPVLRARSLYLPLTLITYGFVSRSSGELKEFDTQIKDEIRKNSSFHTRIDDYLQYTPGLAVYGLNAVGIKGQHNFRDRTLIYLLSNVISGITVSSLKSITKELRPDGSAITSFPSGHTATAFTGAEFLRQEYKNVSPWYGIAGYTVATATGILRMYNNKHWLRDVVAGAGVGILSTEVAYWLAPKIAKILFRKKTAYHFDPAKF